MKKKHQSKIVYFRLKQIAIQVLPLVIFGCFFLGHTPSALGNTSNSTHNGTDYELTAANNATGANADAIDSDGTIAAGVDPDFDGEPYLQITTGSAGQVNHTYDFGFRVLSTCNMSLSYNQATCIDNGDGTFTASYDVTIFWTDAPSTGNLTLSLFGEGTLNTATIPASTIVGSTTITLSNAFTVFADGIGSTGILAFFDEETTCKDSIGIKAPIPCPADISPCAVAPGCIGGNTFEDFNCNGADDTHEPGVQGIAAQIYDCNNNLVGTGYSDADGDWQVCGLTDGTAYRVEFVLPESVSCWATPTHVAGAGNQSDIQFLTAPACTQFSVSSPQDYCHTNDPEIMLACYDNGDGSNNNNTGFVRYTYSDDGIPDQYDSGSGVANPISIATVSEIGTVFGAAYNRTAEHIYATSILKRHVSLGPLGLGGVYIIHPNNGYVGSFDLAGVVPANGGAALDFGAINRSSVPGAISSGTAGDYQLSETPTEVTVDLDAFGKISKTGMGDTDLSEDGSMLWTINLNDAQTSLISVHLKDTSNPIPTDGSSPNSTIVNRYLLSDMNPPSCTNGTFRPFALAFHHGRGYLGGVCSAENGGTDTDLQAYVLSFDPNNPIGGLTSEISFALDYTREFKSDFNSHKEISAWVPWTDDWTDLSFNNGKYLNNACPVLADIEFTEKGDMVLGFIDRFSLQLGYQQYAAVSGAESGGLYDVEPGGDIIHICNINGNWVLEGDGSGSCNDNDTGNGPGTSLTNDGPNNVGEYYWSDYWKYNDSQGHSEITLGGLAQLKGTQEVVSIVYDPIPRVDGGDGNTQGTNTFNTNTGDRNRGYMVVNEQGTNLGKSIGLGEPIFACNPAPLEIGNYVWCDSLQNGIQDPCERGINDLIVQLYNAAGDLIAQDTTVSGNYYFNQNNVDTTGITVDGSGDATPVTAWSGMDYSTQYFIVFGNGQYSGGEFSIGGDTYDGVTSMVNAGTNDNVDSDVDGSALTSGSLGARPDGLPFIDMTTSATGCGAHKYDMGILCISCTEPDLVTTPNTICEGGNVDIATLVTDNNNIGGTLFFYNSLTDANNQSNPLSTTLVSPIIDTKYYVREDTLNCFDIDSIMIVVNNITAPVLGSDVAYCTGEDPSVIALSSAASGDGNLSYQWQSNTTGCMATFTDITTAGMSATYDPPVLSATTYYRVITTSTLGTEICTDTSNCITITINSNPTATPSPAIACTNSIDTINGSPSGGSGVYTTHTWTDLTTGTASNYILQSASNSQKLIVDASNATTGTINLEYYVVDNNGCSYTTPHTVLITEPETAFVCRDTSNHVVIRASTGLSNIVWYNSADVQVGTGDTLAVDAASLGMEDGMDSYYYNAADASGCDAGLCCPVLVATEDCCKPNICLPFTVTIKRGNRN